MAFVTPYDIANRGLQHLGIPILTTFADDSIAATEMGFVYDKLRQAELETAVWTFATRRMIMRPVVDTTKSWAAATYSAGTTYAAGDVVADANGFLWLSTRGSNVANTPGIGGVNPAWIVYFGPMVSQQWDTAVVYYPGDVVHKSGGSIAYISIKQGSAQDPVSATTYWHAVAGATLSAIVTLFPVAYLADPTASIRTIYRLPANFVRLAPQTARAAGTAGQQTTAGVRWNDFEIEAGYLMSAAKTGAFILRFVADQADVTAMSPLFCEVLGASMGAATCETITQAQDKLMACRRAYTDWQSRARLVNAIEAGSTEGDVTPAPVATGAGGPQQ